ncbi:MAG: hypothetical protein ACRDP6_01745 [Actinoallomurus sp.]
MPQVAYVYVPKPSRRNLEIGLAKGVWGWKAETLDRAEGRDVVASLDRGDFLVLGHRGPNPRVLANGWQVRTLRRVIVGQVTRRLYTSESVVWPDGVYPERVDLEILGDFDDVTDLGSGAMEALRLSGTKQGTAVKGSGAEAVFALALMEPARDVTSEVETSRSEVETDVMRSVFVRKEQARLRRQKFGGAEEIECAICRRALPARIVHAAHIRRREAANYTQRMDPANIMAACTLGCDTLFEFGFIYVDEDGLIRVAPTTPLALAAAASGLEGERCDAFHPASEIYFEYHRTEIAKAV